MIGCRCLDQWAAPVAGTDACRCLDNTTEWNPNGSACGIPNPEQTAYVNTIRNQYDFKNDAGTRAAKNRSNLKSWADSSLDSSLSNYEAKLKSIDSYYNWRSSVPSYCTTCVNTVDGCNKVHCDSILRLKEGALARQNHLAQVANIRSVHTARAGFIDAAEAIESKNDRTPRTNNFFALTAALPDGRDWAPTWTWQEP